MKPLLPCLCLLLPAAAFGAKMDWPRMPDVPTLSKTGALSQWAITAQLQTVLAPEEKLVLSAPAPDAVHDAEAAAEAAAETRVPVVAHVDRYPVIAFSDISYASVPYDYVPVMVDWFEALLKSMDLTAPAARASGLTTNRISRLMRVFLEVRLHLKDGTEAGIAPAIGWARFHCNEDWGRFRRGHKYTVVVIATDQGWIALDPYTRRVRPLVKHDPEWVMEFLVL